MKIKCFQLSSIGTVRDHNEDFIAFWEPEDFQQLQAVGSIAVRPMVWAAKAMVTSPAPGGGNRVGNFQGSQTETSANDSVRRIFDEAAARIFQAAQKQGRMSTTCWPPFFATTRSPSPTSAIPAPTSSVPGKSSG